MRTRKRVVLDNVYYHVINRGNQKQKIFFKEDDFEKYLALLKRYKRKYNFKLLAWCLMPNHVHLIIHLEDASKLARLMQGLNLAYAKWFNKKYGLVGHLWQGRFKSMVIQKDDYAIDCLNYVEFNPVRANIIQNPMDYKWSSYRSRALGERSYILDRLYL